MTNDLTRALFACLGSEQDSAEDLALLLEAGADPDARDETGKPALFAAIENPAKLRVLIEHGADVTATWDMGPLTRGKVSRLIERLIPEEHRPDPAAPVIMTLADYDLGPEIIRLVVASGLDPLAFDATSNPPDLAVALGTDLIPETLITPESFHRHGTPRPGTANPEAYLPDFWREQIRTLRSGYAAEVAILGRRDTICPAAPVWSFDRFGRTATRLPDGRLVLIGGEHEDFYDPDFCIYADVTVLDGAGGVEHYIYPEEVFPPTDFHSATLMGDHILLIGALGYRDRRTEGVTQVLRLHLADFSVERVETRGEAPGWIHRHEARLEKGCVVVSGGKIEPGYRDNTDRFALDPATMVWTRLGD